MTQFDCTDIKAMLSAIVDDQLEADQRHHVERHLASCAPCRKTVDEAEAIDTLLALDLEGAQLRGGLPSGFEDSVLSRTVHANPMRLRSRRWVTVGGWMASAAAIALAMTIWIVDRRAMMRQAPLVTGNGPSAVDTPNGLSYASNVTNSWIYEGPVEPASAKSGDASKKVESAPPTIERIIQSATLTRDDVDTLYASALALDRLRGAETISFEDLDTVRRIVEYDDLLPRLAQSHPRLNADDRTAVLAAESIFTRIVRGPINADDLAEITQTLTTLELPDRLARIGRRMDASLSL